MSNQKKFLDRLGHEWLFCDGGTGTLLQSMGLGPGELPETWNVLHPDRIQKLNESYLEAGADIIYTNTFGANRLKYPNGTDLEDYVTAAVKIAIQARKAAGREDDAYVALDIGPTGKLLEPMGDLSFDRAVELFGEIVRIGTAAGADLVIIETMTDSYEAKAAVLAAKENCSLPIMATTTYDASGKLLTGGSVESVVALLEGLGVNALGINCSLGPREMLPIVERLTKAASVPIIVKPNAGLPHTDNGKTVYAVGAEEFADIMGQIADLGVQVLGGCCGTTPDYIRRLIAAVRPKPFRPNTVKHHSLVTSFSQSVEIGGRPLIIGERINPTGKKAFREALIRGDLDYIAARALEEEEAGADILDVNVGIPDIDEADMMEKVVRKLQEVTDLPLQIDTTNPKALERALRIYNGKAMVNSVNGKKDQIETVMPIVKKYGGVLVGLCIDEQGIPNTAEGRLAVARKIYNAAARYGLRAEDIVIDGLAMTISSEPEGANITLETIRRVHDELHGHTILGVSNISFGLPQRGLINAFFFTMAMQCGLSCAIVNPNNEGMMAAFRTFLALTNQDPQCMQFIEKYAASGPVVLGNKKQTTGSPASKAPGSDAGQEAASTPQMTGQTGGSLPEMTDQAAGSLPGMAGQETDQETTGARNPAGEMVLPPENIPQPDTIAGAASAGTSGQVLIIAVPSGQAVTVGTDPSGAITVLAGGSAAGFHPGSEGPVAGSAHPVLRTAIAGGQYPGTNHAAATTGKAAAGTDTDHVQGTGTDNIRTAAGADNATITDGTDYIRTADGTDNVKTTAGTDNVRTTNGTGNTNAISANSSKSTRTQAANAAPGGRGLSYYIQKGLKDPAASATRAELDAGRPAMDIIDQELIPALNIVGQGFEKGTVFLPQLLMAAEASKSAFSVIRETMAGKPREVKGKIILATVKGDIHDIGKNIVKVLLENYGYDVIDLGKDVPPETIVDAAIKDDIKLVGLSALMTTTVPSMEETIRMLHKEKPDCRIIVGGAVMTQEYADKIHADAFGKDAMSTVRYADSVFEA